MYEFLLFSFTFVVMSGLILEIHVFIWKAELQTRGEGRGKGDGERRAFPPAD